MVSGSSSSHRRKTILGTTLWFFTFASLPNDTTVLVTGRQRRRRRTPPRDRRRELERLFGLLGDGNDPTNHPELEGTLQGHSDKMRSGSIYEFGRTCSRAHVSREVEEPVVSREKRMLDPRSS